jgi:DNA modification methylase
LIWQLAEQCLRVVTLTHADKPRLTIPKGPPAPLVELGRAHVLKSVAGCLNSPFDFMGASLRQKYSDDWDRAILLREKTFRNELYSLFPQREIIRVPTQVKIRQGNRVITDIDAAIFDPQNNIGGLFQLKWQEPFGPSIRARDSRKKNFTGPTIAG